MTHLSKFLALVKKKPTKTPPKNQQKTTTQQQQPKKKKKQSIKKNKYINDVAMTFFHPRVTSTNLFQITKIQTRRTYM